MFRINKCTTNYAAIFLFSLGIIFAKNSALPMEFGNVLTQGSYPVRHTDVFGKELIEFAENYAKKRFPQSVPIASQQPDVVEFRQKKLVYSFDNVNPLVYDDVITDKFGNEHDITNLLIIGTLYQLVLTWQQNLFKYVHNFTISVNPSFTYHVYSHTCYVRSFNSTRLVSDKIQARYNEHIADSYFSSFIKVDLEGKEEYSYKDVTIQHKHAQGYHHTGSNSHIKHSDMEDGDSVKHDDQKIDGDVMEAIDDQQYISLHAEDFKSKQQFSVMSYNIWNMNSKSQKANGYTTRMNRLRKVIQQADPDIIGFQEVRYEEKKGEKLGPCQIETLTKWFTQYQYVYQPAQMQPNTLNDGRTEEGVAILSKYPIIAHDYFKLFINRSNSADTHQRILLHAEINIPSIGIVHVFTTHLSLSHEAREESMVQIWDQIRSLHAPAILLGDFNAEPHEPAMRYIRDVSYNGDADHHNAKRHQHQQTHKLHDLWTYTHNDTNKGFTFNVLEKNLTKRIDYIMFRDWESCCHVDSCEIIDDGFRGSFAASDHVPIVAVFSKVRKSKVTETVS